MLQNYVFIFISMISKKWIGATITIKHKNIRQTIVIEDDPARYSQYRMLGLDHIFESEPKKMTFPKTKKRRKKSDSNISKPSEHSSVDANGEDDNK